MIGGVTMPPSADSRTLRPGLIETSSTALSAGDRVESASLPGLKMAVMRTEWQKINGAPSEADAAGGRGDAPPERRAIASNNALAPLEEA